MDSQWPNYSDAAIAIIIFFVLAVTDFVRASNQTLPAGLKRRAKQKYDIDSNSITIRTDFENCRRFHVIFTLFILTGISNLIKFIPSLIETLSQTMRPLSSPLKFARTP